MDCNSSARQSPVVVLVVEITVIYDITVVRRTVFKQSKPTTFPAKTQIKKSSTEPTTAGQRISKNPDVNIYQQSPVCSVVSKSLVPKESTTSTNNWTPQEIRCADKSCEAKGAISYKSKGKIIVDENCNTIFEATKEVTSPEEYTKEVTNPSLEEYTEGQKSEVAGIFTTKEASGSDKVDSICLLELCGVHRDCVRESIRKGQFERKTRKMEGYNGDQGDHGCLNGDGCVREGSPDWGKPRKEIPITECLNEFLESLHLSHLGDYLRVLGCTCVRDLRLLAKEELNAIQLISRRRLLQQLEHVNLHHEAPPADCSLDGWLTWYGLTHIAGFLAAIGVHSVGDLTYLDEEDLLLLKPVTRRRILTCNRK